MKRRLLTCYILFLFTVFICSQESFMYRLELSDKGPSGYSINRPHEFLSRKSIERRHKQGIDIDTTDLPISPVYLQKIDETGAHIRATSKWINTVTIQLEDTACLMQLKNLEFIDTVYCVWKGHSSLPDKINPVFFKNQKWQEEIITENTASLYSPEIYGQGYKQISLINGQLLHAAGFKGKGMRIAVIDGGFKDYDRIQAFNKERIKEIRNFTHQEEEPQEINESHGTRVLSCMLADQPDLLIGTAPDADYYLYISEVAPEEYPVEEDYWITAVEYADSMGIDIINTSLGYTTFDESYMNHTYEESDGIKNGMSRVAALAANKGMLVFIAAGNEGNKTWGKISFPGDAKDIITVGAIDSTGKLAAFSSIGPTADGRIKPDLVSMGSGNAILDQAKVVIRGNGTSFATPVLAGAAACLWQALPDKTAKEIRQILLESGNRAESPDSLYGYGIPDVYKAAQIHSATIREVEEESGSFFYDSKNHLLYFYPYRMGVDIKLKIYHYSGYLAWESDKAVFPVYLDSLPGGIYFARFGIEDKQMVRKFIKF